jgi:hypothetical protein
MRRRTFVWIGLVAALVVSAPLARAQNTTGQGYTHSVVTVSTTAQSFPSSAITPTGQPAATSCTISVNTNGIAFRFDGVAATASDHVVPPGTTFNIRGANNLSQFSMIRSTASDASVAITCSRGPLQPAPVEVAATGSVSVGGITAGAQPANDPHFVRCSDSAVAAPCLVGDGTGPLTVDGTVTVTDGAGALNAIIDSGTLTAVTAITNAVTVTDGAGALNVICDSGCGGSGGTSLADDADFTAGTTSFTPVGGFYQSTVTACTDGDTCAVSLTPQRAIHVNLRDAAGAELSVGGGTQYTEDAAAAANPVGNALNLVRADTLAGVTSADGDNVSARGTNNGELYVKHVDALTVNSHAVTNAGTFATQVTSIAAGDNNIGNVDLASAIPAGTNTIGAVRLRDSAGDEVTDATANAVKTLPVDAAGTALTVGSDATTNTTTQTTGPGVFCNASTATPTAVGADGRNIAFWCDTNGRLNANSVVTALPNEGQQTAANSISVALSADKNACADDSQVIGIPITTATSGNVELVAISGSTIVYVCGFDVTSVADVSIQFVSGTGTACATGETNKTGVYNLSAAAGAGMRGIVRSNGGATQFKGAAGEAMCIELSAAVQVDGLLTYVQR